MKYNALLLVSFMLVQGCSDGKATFEGNITFNGEPVNRGAIMLEPTNGKGTSFGGKVENGKFKIDKILPGEMLVRINAAYVAKTEKAYPENPNDTSVIEICEELIPEEYNGKSTTKVTIKAPKTIQEFSITGDDPRKKIVPSK